MADRMQIIAQRIRRAREKAGLSQAEVARRLKISPSAVSMYECGEREPTFDLLSELSEVLGVEQSSLLGVPPSEADLKIALFGSGDVSDDTYKQVLEFAKFCMEKEKNGQ